MWNVARRLHRWLGIALALPLVAQAVTGCIIAFDEPAVVGITQAPGARQKVSAIIAAAHAAAPDLLPSHYRTGMLPQSLASVDLAATGQRDAELRLTIDPVTLAVVSVDQATQPYWRLARDLHENLLIPLSGGRSIIGWFGVGLLVLGITGALLWWQRPRQDLARRGSMSNVWFLRELHAGIGIWLVAMLIVQAVSGISLAFPRTMRSLLGIEARPAINVGADGGTLDVDAVVERATTAVPGAQLTDLLLPRAPGRPAIAVMRIEAGWDSGRRGDWLAARAAHGCRIRFGVARRRDPAGHAAPVAADHRPVDVAQSPASWADRAHQAKPNTAAIEREIGTDRDDRNAEPESADPAHPALCRIDDCGTSG